MDKLTHYQNAIMEILEEYSHYLPYHFTDAENQVIADKERHHYVLMSLGWEGRIFHYGPVMQFDIKNGKIWIQANNTEVDVGKALTDRGVPATDIVVGFQPEEYRPYSGYATA